MESEDHNLAYDDSGRSCHGRIGSCWCCHRPPRSYLLRSWSSPKAHGHFGLWKSGPRSEDSARATYTDFSMSHEGQLLGRPATAGHIILRILPASADHPICNSDRSRNSRLVRRAWRPGSFPRMPWSTLLISGMDPEWGLGKIKVSKEKYWKSWRISTIANQEYDVYSEIGQNIRIFMSYILSDSAHPKPYQQDPRLACFLSPVSITWRALTAPPSSAYWSRDTSKAALQSSSAWPWLLC